MTTMPPETSTTILANPLIMPNINKSNTQNDTHSMQQYSSRSRFMITDILAGNEEAETSAALRNKCNTEAINVKNITNINLSTYQSSQHHHHHHHQHQQNTIHQYLSQQNQDLIRQQQQQQRYFIDSTFRQQQLAHSLHTQHLLRSRQQTSLLSCDSLSHLQHASTNVGATTIDLDKVGGGDGVGADDCGICQDDNSQSPRPHTKNDSHFSSQSDHEKINLVGGGIVSGGGKLSGGSVGDPSITFDDSDSDTCGGEDANSCKSDNLMGLTKKQRKARTAFTDHQLQTLEKSFERQKYLSVQDRMELANKLELSDCQVKTWYQNRRTKWKRQTAVGLELLAEAGNYAAFQRLYGNQHFLPAWPYVNHHGAPANSIDLYYRQAAAAAVLQKPVSHRMYPSLIPPMNGLSPIPVPTSSLAHHLNASNTLSTLSGYYHTPDIVQHSQTNTNNSNTNHFSLSHISDQRLNVESELDRSRNICVSSDTQVISSAGNNSEHNEKDEDNISNHSHFDGDNDDDDDDAIEV